MPDALLCNDGTGKFDSLPYQEIPESASCMFTVGDLSGDGKRDMYVVAMRQDWLVTSHLTDSGGKGSCGYLRFTRLPQVSRIRRLPAERSRVTGM